MLPYQLHQKLKQAQQQKSLSANFNLNLQLDQLRDLPFYIWNKEEHKQEYIKTEGQCCFNHVVGLPTKNGVHYPLFDYEKLLYDSLISNSGIQFQQKHLWVKKRTSVTGLGVTEFMLRMMGLAMHYWRI